MIEVFGYLLLVVAISTIPAGLLLLCYLNLNRRSRDVVPKPPTFPPLRLRDFRDAQPIGMSVWVWILPEAVFVDDAGAYCVDMNAEATITAVGSEKAATRKYASIVLTHDKAPWLHTWPLSTLPTRRLIDFEDEISHLDPRSTEMSLRLDSIPTELTDLSDCPEGAKFVPVADVPPVDTSTTTAAKGDPVPVNSWMMAMVVGDAYVPAGAFMRANEMWFVIGEEYEWESDDVGVHIHVDRAALSYAEGLVVEWPTDHPLPPIIPLTDVPVGATMINVTLQS